MYKLLRLAFCFLVFVILNSTNYAQAEIIYAKVVDGLGRPIPNVIFEFYMFKKDSKGVSRAIILSNVLSNKRGIVKWRYDLKTIKSLETVWVKVSKDGYSGYSTGINPVYLIKKLFNTNDLIGILNSDSEAQKDQMLEILGGEFAADDNDPYKFIFYNEKKFRPILKSLLDNPKVFKKASIILASIAVPEDIKEIIYFAPKKKGRLFEDRWAYSVVCGLLAPNTPDEWQFLKNCALNYYDDYWVEYGAINSLKLIATERSLEILREIQRSNKRLETLIADAIEYIRSNPHRLEDQDIEEAGKKVALAIKIGKWEGNKGPIYNAEGDKAKIDCSFISGRDLLIYTATFHRLNGVWKLRNVHETVQIMLANVKDQSNE